MLAVTGPQYERGRGGAPRAPPKRSFLDLVPPEGVKLTPRHYAYLKISEGCNNRCSCIVEAARRSGVATGRRRAARGGAAVKAGVKELLVISQDTSAYG